MALPVAGIRLTAENATSFYRDVDKSSTSLSSFGSSATTTAKAVNAFNQETSLIKLDTLANTLADQKTRLAQYGAQLDEITKKEGEGSAKAQAKAAQMDSLAGKISINERRYAALATEINNEADAEQHAATATESMTTALTHETSSTREASTSASKFSAELIIVGNEASTAEGKVSKLSEIATGGLRKLGEIGVTALGNVASGIGDFVRGSVTAAADFESSLNTFASVTGTSIADAGYTLDEFKQKFLDLGRDTTFSASQAAQAGNELAKGGVPIRAIMGDATEATLALASAGNLQLAPAAEIVAKQLGVWGSTGVTATDVADRLSQAANASTVDVDELAAGLANVGGAARGTGVSFNETVTTLGLISPAFNSASTAATSYNNFLARIQPTAKPAIEAMTNLGLYTKETGSAFFDAQGHFVGMEKASGLLANALNGLSEADRMSAVQTIFGNDAKITAIELARQGSKGYADFAKAMESQGTAADQGAKKNAGFNKAMDALGGSVETAQIAIGDKLLPVGTALINDFLVPAVNKFAEFIKGVGPIADTVGKVAGVLSDLLIPAAVGATSAFVAFKLATGGGLYNTLFGLAETLGGVSLGLETATGAAWAATGAFLKMAIPLAAITVSIGAIVVGIQDYNKKVDNAIAATLNMASGYTNAGTALQHYAEGQANLQHLSTTQRQQTEAQATSLESLRHKLEEATDAYYSIGGGTEANLRAMQNYNEQLKLQAAFMDVIIRRNAEVALVEETKAKQLQSQVVDYNNLEAAADGYGAVVENANGKVVVSTGLSEKAIEALNESLDKIRENGPGVFDGIVHAQADFISGTEQRAADHKAAIEALTTAQAAATIDTEKASIQDRINAENAGYAQQELDAGVAYAEAQAAQRSHLGQMLIDYATAQAEIHGVSDEALNALVGGIRDKYGVMVDINAQSFGTMTGDIDNWAANGGKNSAQLASDLGTATDAASTTQKQMDDLAKEYEAKFVNDFKDGKITADELAQSINDIPRLVRSDINIHTTYTQSGTPAPGGGRGPDKEGPRAFYTGGFAARGEPILVGDDHGKPTRYSELIVPNTNSTVYNARDTRKILRANRERNRDDLEQERIDRHTGSQRDRAEQDKIDRHQREQDQRRAEDPVALEQERLDRHQAEQERMRAADEADRKQDARDRKRHEELFGQFGPGLMNAVGAKLGMTEGNLTSVIQATAHTQVQAIQQTSDDLRTLFGQTLGGGAPSRGGGLLGAISGVQAGMSDLLGTIGRPGSLRAPLSPQASATDAIRAMMPVGGQPPVTKQYILNARVEQPIASIIGTFHTMEAFSL